MQWVEQKSSYPLWKYGWDALQLGCNSGLIYINSSPFTPNVKITILYINKIKHRKQSISTPSPCRHIATPIFNKTLWNFKPKQKLCMFSLRKKLFVILLHFYFFIFMNSQLILGLLILIYEYDLTCSIEANWMFTRHPHLEGKTQPKCNIFAANSRIMAQNYP